MKKSIFISVSVIALLIAYVFSDNLFHQPLKRESLENKNNGVIEDQVLHHNGTVNLNHAEEKSNTSHSEINKSTEHSNSKIATCDKEPNFDIYQYFASQETLENNIFDDTYLSNLLDQDAVSLESQTTQALLSLAKNPDDISSLLELYQENQNNKLIAHHVLIACKTQKCDKTLISNALNTDRNNGASWLAYANLIHSEENIENTISALINAANAPVYTEYWSERFNLVDETLNQLGVNTEYSPILSQPISAAFPLPGFGVISGICQNADPNDIRLLDACINLGTKLELSQSTLISTAIGVALQRKIFSKLDDQNALSFLEEKSKGFNQQMMQNAKASQIVMRNKQYALAYFEYLKHSSEVAASSFLINQAKALSSLDGFDPCAVNW